MSTELAQIFDLAQRQEALRLEANAPQTSLWRRWSLNREAAALEKAVASAAARQADRYKAEEQGVIVNDLLDMLGYYDHAQGVRERVTITFNALRGFADTCEPLAAIINTRVNQVSSFAQIYNREDGFVKNAGFRIRLSNPEAEPSKSQRFVMRQLEQFVLEGGLCQPPKSEQPVGYQPGFDTFIRQIVRDTLTMDWCAVRVWEPEDAQSAPFNLACFAAEDAARIRLVQPEDKGVKDGVRQLDEWSGRERVNTDKAIVFVKLQAPMAGSPVIEEYTDRELFVGVRNARTDARLNGYGMAESEMALNAISGWIWGRDFNASRFHKDALPRGILSLLGEVNEQQLKAFRLEWKQMMQGLAHRWNIPIIRGFRGERGGVAWTPLDQSNRDLEYQQWMFTVALWLHAVYGIHPEETGYQAISPFRPPLSEASPEVKLKYSQDSGLNPLLRWLQAFINRNIIWRMFPGREYRLEFVGLGDYSEIEQVELWTAELNAGLNTPGNIWASRDLPRPPGLEDHPAWDFPAPLLTGIQYFDALEQQQQALRARREAARQASLQQAQTQTGEEEFGAALDGTEASERTNLARGEPTIEAMAQREAAPTALR